MVLRLSGVSYVSLAEQAFKFDLLSRYDHDYIAELHIININMCLSDSLICLRLSALNVYILLFHLLLFTFITRYMFYLSHWLAI